MTGRVNAVEPNSNCRARISTNWLESVCFALGGPRRSLALVFVVAVFNGFLALSLNGGHSISRDSISFHNAAVHLAAGEGYTHDGKDPFFFREPGYSAFLAGIYRVSSVFITPRLLDYDLLGKDANSRQNIGTEVLIAGVIQSFMGGMTIVLTALLLRSLFSSGFISLWGLLLAAYYPYMCLTVSILREGLQSLLLVLLGLCLLQYTRSGKVGFLFIAGILCGLHVLTFQAMAVLVGGSAATIAVRSLASREWRTLSSIRNLLFFLVAFSLTVAPWIVHVYRYYPDPRIIKTFGISLTHESLKYVTAVRRAEAVGLISEPESRRLQREDWYQITSRERFEKSFSGWYEKEAAKLTQQIGSRSEHRLTSKVRNLLLSSYNLFVQRMWRPAPNIQESVRRRNLGALILHITSLVVGLGSLIGWVLILPRWKILAPLIPYIAIVAIWYVLGSEYRRFLPVYPIVFVGFCFFVVIAIEKWRNSEANSCRALGAGSAILIADSHDRSIASTGAG